MAERWVWIHSARTVLSFGQTAISRSTSKTPDESQRIRTGMAIAGFHNSREKRKVYETAFLRVLLPPGLKPFRRSFRESLANTQKRGKAEFSVRLQAKSVGQRTGVSYCLIRPLQQWCGLWASYGFLTFGCMRPRARERG